MQKIAYISKNLVIFFSFTLIFLFLFFTTIKQVEAKNEIKTVNIFKQSVYTHLIRNEDILHRNIILNHSFELGFEDWTIFNEKNSPYLYHEESIHGNYSLYFENNSSEGSGIVGSFVKVEKNSKYKIRIVAKADNIQQGEEHWHRFMLIGRFYDKDKNELTDNLPDLGFDTGTYDWTVFERIVETDNNTEYFKINNLGLIKTCTGKALIDSIEVYKFTGDDYIFSLDSLSKNYTLDKNTGLLKIKILSENISNEKLLFEIYKSNYYNNYTLNLNIKEKPYFINNSNKIGNFETQVEYLLNNSKFEKFDIDTLNKYQSIIDQSEGDLSEKEKFNLATFVNYGTYSTRKLGAGERAGVLNSYLSAFHKIPKSEENWIDVIKIANGRWPGEINIETERNSENIFRKIYLRKPNFDNINDKIAIKIISYGLRPKERKILNEKNAINSFKTIYYRYPNTSLDWDIVRAIGYSGASR